MKEFFEGIKRITDAYRAGAGLPPLKNPPEPEVLNGRDEDYTDCDEHEPDRYPDLDAETDDPRRGQAAALNRERHKPKRSE